MVKDHSDSARGNMGYYFRLTARVLLYTSSHRQDNTHHGLCYTSRGPLAGTRNSSMGPLKRIDPTTHRTMSERSYEGATSRSQFKKKVHEIISTQCIERYPPIFFFLIPLLTPVAQNIIAFKYQHKIFLKNKTKYKIIK